MDEQQVRGHILSNEERQGLTIWADTFSAQVRDKGQLAICIRDDIPRSSEDGNPVILDSKGVLKLAALLAEARGRFMLIPEHKVAPDPKR